MNVDAWFPLAVASRELEVSAEARAAMLADLAPSVAQAAGREGRWEAALGVLPALRIRDTKDSADPNQLWLPGSDQPYVVVLSPEA